MNISIKVTPIDGEPYEVQTNLFTIVAFERKFKMKASDLATGVGMEHLAFMAYESCKQQGITVPAVFDDYIKRINAIDVVTGDTANPTNEAQSSEH
jgi:hypothetical protein